MTIEEMKAQFAARGGTVTKVAEGERTLKPREMYMRTFANDEKRERYEARKRDRDEPRITVVTDHAGREFYRNEAGEWL